MQKFLDTKAVLILGEGEGIFLQEISDWNISFCPTDSNKIYNNNSQRCVWAVGRQIIFP